MSLALNAGILATTPPADVVVDVAGVNHWFGEGETRTQVLINNKLQINRGEIVIMLGPSGSGKTTLLTLIGALRRVQQGSLSVLGWDLHKMTPDQLVEVRRSIGFIFQAHNLFSSLTAMQNVQLALELKQPDTEARRERARKVLLGLNLEERHLNYRPEQLSGGLKQRVAIARALANQPRLILADEPTAALDAKSADVVVEELKKLAKTGASEERSTILVVTHDEKILGMADRIVTMKRGSIVSNVRREVLSRIVRALKECRLFSGLSDDTLQRIGSRMGREDFVKDVTIIRQGDEADRFYLILQGSVEVIHEIDGTQIRTRVLNPGDVFGELALLEKGGRRTRTIKALEDVALFSMNERDFHATMAESPMLNEELARLYSSGSDEES